MTGVREGWWSTFYDDLFFAAVLEGASGEQDAELLWRGLGLTSGSRVLDQCCGDARVGCALARRGCEVLGVDQSSGYIERARRRAEREGVEVALHVDDARTFRPSALCDGVFNWWTSFGHGTTDADNARLLVAAGEALKPGGRYALDFPNFAQLVRTFKERWVETRRGPAGVFEVERSSQLDLHAGLLRQRWRLRDETGREQSRESVLRMYWPHALVELVESVGFEQVRLTGIDGAALGLDSPRARLWAVWPGAPGAKR